MKHFTHILPLILLCTLLCACSSGNTAPTETAATTAPTETAPAPTEKATEPVIPDFEDDEEEAEEEIFFEETEDGNELLAIAKSLIDHPVEELYEAIGYPESSDYASSCLVPGAEDGNLYYEDFIVYTIRKSSGETVYDAE